MTTLSRKSKMPSTTTPFDSPRSDIVPPRAPKLRPHAAVIVLIFLLLGAAWLGRRAAADGAMKNVSLLFGGSLAFWILFGWFVFRSDYSRRWRWLSVLLVVGAFAVFGLLFRVERFDGSLVPTLAYRTAPSRDTQLSPDLTEELTNVKPDLSRTSETDFPGFLGKDGNKCARNMRIANRLSWATAIAGTIAGLAGWAPGYALARGALMVTASATALDKVWKYLVDGGTKGDGIVSLHSQRALPGKTAEVRIVSGPTHQKVTRSFEAKQLMELQLRSRFGAAINGVPIP